MVVGNSGGDDVFSYRVPQIKISLDAACYSFTYNIFYNIRFTTTVPKRETSAGCKSIIGYLYTAAIVTVLRVSTNSLAQPTERPILLSCCLLSYSLSLSLRASLHRARLDRNFYRLQGHYRNRIDKNLELRQRPRFYYFS